MKSKRNTFPRQASLLPGYCLLSLALASSSQALLAAPPSTHVQQRTYKIAAGPLERVLSNFAAASGVMISFEPQLAQALYSDGLHGEYDVAQGFTQLLKGTTLDLQSDGSGNYQLRPRNATTLEPLDISASRLSGAVTEGTDVYTTAQMSTATKLAISVRETPQSVSVVSRKQMDDQRMLTLDDALESTTGVNVLMSSENLILQSRGFKMESIQYDGLATNFQEQMLSPDLALYDRIEVLRGAPGLVQGGGMPGGTVNLVRKRPTADFQASVDGSAGSWDTYRITGDVSGPLNDNGTVRGRLVGAYQDNQSFIDYVQAERQALYGVVEIDLNPDTTLTLGSSWQKDDSVPTGFGLPMAKDGSSLGLSRSTFLSAPWAYLDSDGMTYFAELEHELANDWKIKAAGSFSEYQRDSLNLFTYNYGGSAGVDPKTGTGLVLDDLTQRNYHDRNLSGDLSAQGPFELLSREHTLIVGAAYSRNRFTGTFNTWATVPGSYAQYGEPINVYNFSPGDLTLLNQPEANRYLDEQTLQKGVYLTTRLSLADPLHLILGARVSWYDYHRNVYNLPANTLNTTSSAAYDIDQELTPYAGITYDLNDQLTWYFSYSDIFKPQRQQAYPSGVIDPIVGANYETGIKGEFYDGALNLSAAVFRIDQSHLAQIDYAHSLSSCTVNNGVNRNDGRCFYEAAGKVRSQGVELEAAGELMPGWQVFAGYTFNRSEYLKYANGGTSDQAGENYSSFTPKHLFRAGTDYRLGGNWSAWNIGAGIKAQSSWSTTDGNQLAVREPGRALVDLHGGYRFDEHLRIAVNIENLFDKVYYENYSQRTADYFSYYGAPRSATVSLHWRY
ncbi:TonB-dependent siderophore receptor [Pseudomonas putida]|uniref:TonB-dependent siderophore receptor n=1 Tax=Pseudomonas putida TaxID=303 RepID=A0AAP9N275_PSEPU|nr:TonB-dependent receptor [Pseudomonas putida]QJQ11551.1 TonB-dependent siderophore receptor [Pseudomonas putida]